MTERETCLSRSKRGNQPRHSPAEWRDPFPPPPLLASQQSADHTPVWRVRLGRVQQSAAKHSQAGEVHTCSTVPRQGGEREGERARLGSSPSSKWLLLLSLSLSSPPLFTALLHADSASVHGSVHVTPVRLPLSSSLLLLLFYQVLFPFQIRHTAVMRMWSHSSTFRSLIHNRLSTSFPPSQLTRTEPSHNPYPSASPDSEREQIQSGVNQP
ncbi:hypothetical protein IE53DRAFT_172103 [Violaceomyces palustris]|uniref:Uncharacterized protein n=1 Tax=Violaceomyces palustris TaxID=1673888 RepID=A0ACD0NSZ4_9BASI|nr:hypothetical protein IE53DRAFT_172103 [Violaceomyces palustris]